MFSLKSSRSFSRRFPVGGEYGAISSTALRGLIPPFGSLIAKPHLNGSRVRFQSLRSRKRSYRRRDPLKRLRLEPLITRCDLDDVNEAFARMEAGETARSVIVY